MVRPGRHRARSREGAEYPTRIAELSNAFDGRGRGELFDSSERILAESQVAKIPVIMT